jgi:DNA polymerase III alpha subunit
MGVTEAENLIRSGALDFTAIERPRLLYQLHAHYREFAKRREGSRGLLGLGRNAEGPALADHSELEKLADEWRLLGLSWRGHPLSYRREELKRLGVVTSDRLEGSSRGEITLAGLLAASRRVETRTGGEMLFLTMDDESGVYEVTVEGETAARVCKLLGSIGPYLVTGRVDRRHGALSLAARNITRYPRVG